MKALERLRFIFVTGKGGVGKTTVSAALALRLSQRGKRVLLAITGAERRFSLLLGSRPIEREIAEVVPGVSAVLLTPEVAFREYGRLVLKSKRVSDALFDNKYVQGLFQGAPGLKEWALLGKAWYHATEILANGDPRFDVVLFDAPATGHGLDMLRVPKVIVELSPPGMLRSDAERAWAFFRDPHKSGSVVVTLPEELPTNETLELVTAIRDELGLPVAGLIVNGTVPELFDAASREKLAALIPERLSSEIPAERALASAARRALQEKIQSESFSRLRALNVPELRLPWIPGGVGSKDVLSELAAAFDPTLER